MKFEAKRRLFLIIVIIILISLLLIVSYYSFAYIRLNSLVLAANKSGKVSEDDTVLYYLCVIEDEYDSEIYVEIDTDTQLEAISINSITFECEIRATVSDWDTFETISEYSGKREVVFVFENFKWRCLFNGHKY